MESPLLDIWSNLVVALHSKLQPVVTRSTTEAEYIAAGTGGMEIHWFQNLLNDLGYTPSAPAKLSQVLTANQLYSWRKILNIMEG